MIKGKTTSGFEFSINPDVFDDWEMLEKFEAIDNGNANATVSVTREILGQEQLDALKEHLRVDGKVTVTRMQEALEEIFEACSESKN